jgi:hypothetical protein
MNCSFHHHHHQHAQMLNTNLISFILIHQRINYEEKSAQLSSGIKIIENNLSEPLHITAIIVTAQTDELLLPPLQTFPDAPTTSIFLPLDASKDKC